MPFSPSDLSPIALYEAVPSQAFTDAGKTTNVAVGDSVYVASEQINGYDLTQSDFSERPEYKHGRWVFDGTDHMQNASDPVQPGTGDLTIFLKTRGVNDNFQAIAAKGNTGSSDAGWSIYIASGIIIARCGAGGATNRASQTWTIGSNGLAINEWLSLAFVISRSGGTTTTIQGYTNGSTTGWANGGGGPTGNTFPSVASIASADPLTLGAFSTGNNDLNNGAEVAVLAAFPSALNQSQIAQLTNYYTPLPINSRKMSVGMGISI